nr:amidohydrolase family protein [Actinoplanes lichenis]
MISPVATRPAEPCVSAGAAGAGGAGGADIGSRASDPAVASRGADEASSVTVTGGVLIDPRGRWTGPGADERVSVSAAGGGVFDFHARCAGNVRSARALLSVMDSHGITRAAVSAGGVVPLQQLSRQINDGGRADARADNAATFATCKRAPGRLVPVYFADPLRDVDAYSRDGGRFRGLEISPAVHGFRYDDAGVAELVAAAGDAGHSVYTVTLARAGARSADLAALARDFPHVTFVWGHCGHTGLDVAGLDDLAAEPNVLAEISGCLTVTARAAVDRLGAGRVLFGTEYPLQAHSVELAKVAALHLSPADRHRVLWANACRVLGEDPGPAPQMKTTSEASREARRAPSEERIPGANSDARVDFGWIQRDRRAGTGFLAGKE